jgi:hypothetical protein
MSVITVTKDELFEVIQYINLIRARFGTDNIWTVYPVLYSGFESIDLICSSNSVSHLESGQEVSFKFQRDGYEYVVKGEVAEISTKSTSTVTIKFIEAIKYYNLRKHIRFEVELCSQIQGSSAKDGTASTNQYFEATILNLSMGGLMVATSADFASNDFIEVNVTFESGISFKTKAQILRKQSIQNERYFYGVKFIDTSKDDLVNLSEEITKLEKTYFNSLKIGKKSQSTFDTRFAIFSTDVDESYSIREALVKLGAENFDVLTNFKFYYRFISEEKPKFMILDLNSIDNEVEKVIENIGSDFPQLSTLLILPISYQQEDKFKHIISKLDVLFKPLIYNEFEDKIIKYL